MKKCPVCKDASLEVRHRNDIEIDYCPGCRGIWLDRGELEKIIEHSIVETAVQAGSEEEAGEKQPRPPHKRKRNLITELFDF